MFQSRGAHTWSIFRMVALAQHSIIMRHPTALAFCPTANVIIGCSNPNKYEIQLQMTAGILLSRKRPSQHNTLFICVLLAISINLTASSPQPSDPNVVRVNKCCEKFEIIIDNQCAHVNQSGLPHIGN